MALSIKFNRQFYVLKRKGFEYMFGRLKETLEQFDLEKCIYTEDREITLNLISEKEYIKIERICYEQRKRFMNKVCSITNL